MARCWRRRGLGETFSRLPLALAGRRLLRLARPGHKPMPPEFIDMVSSTGTRG